MARPLRIEFSGALYHITSRGDGQDDIYLSDNDRMVFLSILSVVRNKFKWVCHAYCLMTNHYHLLIETPQGNLCKGMQFLNGVYTQRFNRLHSRVGHVFQGRYKAILVEKETYLLELSRYIVLNPVRAKMVSVASEWIWSSYLATTGQISTPFWLSTDWILSIFSESPLEARKKYQQFVEETWGSDSPWEELKNQIYLGSENFVNEIQNKISPTAKLTEIPKPQHMPAVHSLEEYEIKYPSRNQCIKYAYDSGGFSMKEIGDYFELHYSRISRIINSP